MLCFKPLYVFRVKSLRCSSAPGVAGLRNHVAACAELNSLFSAVEQRRPPRFQRQTKESDCLVYLQVHYGC